MKRVTALLLALAFALALCACGADKVSPAGTWVLTGFQDGDKDYTQELKDSGVIILLQMNEDGTGYLDYGDHQETFTWDEEGLMMDPIKLLYTIHGDTLTIGVNDQKMTFTRR